VGSYLLSNNLYRFLAIIYLLIAKFELVRVYSGFGLYYILLLLGYMVKLSRKTNPQLKLES